MDLTQARNFSWAFQAYYFLQIFKMGLLIYLTVVLIPHF